jgi:hypothetical protein
MFTIGAPGQPPQQMKFLMNQVLVKTQSGWKLSSILPISSPAQQLWRGTYSPSGGSVSDNNANLLRDYVFGGGNLIITKTGNA